MFASHALRRTRTFLCFLLSVLTGPEAPACGSRRTDLEDRLLAVAVVFALMTGLVIAFIYRKPLVLGLIAFADSIAK